MPLGKIQKSVDKGCKRAAFFFPLDVHERMEHLAVQRALQVTTSDQGGRGQVRSDATHVAGAVRVHAPISLQHHTIKMSASAVRNWVLQPKASALKVEANAMAAAGRKEAEALQSREAASSSSAPARGSQRRSGAAEAGRPLPKPAPTEARSWHSSQNSHLVPQTAPHPATGVALQIPTLMLRTPSPGFHPTWPGVCSHAPCRPCCGGCCGFCALQLGLKTCMGELVGGWLGSGDPGD